MERIIAGSVILFREKCPNCGEYNMSGNKIFNCNCGHRYQANTVITERKVCYKNKRRNLSKYRNILVKNQSNICYWCGRELDKYYIKNGNVRVLKAVVDHKLPYSYSNDNSIENLCVSCNVCNSYKSDKIFEIEDECRTYIINKINKLIKKGKLIFCEDNYEKESAFNNINHPV